MATNGPTFGSDQGVRDQGVEERDLDEIRHWTLTAAQAAAVKKGKDTVVLDIGEALAITDAFVITSAPNGRLVRAIVEEVEQKVKEAGGPPPLRTEGLAEAQWVLLDYGDFVVHVFLDEVRRFYDLEHLWSGLPRLAWEEEIVTA